jgi:hypothetical protein
MSSAGISSRFCGGAAAPVSVLHIHTLTLIEDAKGNIFCVFTLVKWESLCRHFTENRFVTD